MAVNKFTERELTNLILMLKGFDLAYPELCLHIDRVEYELARKIYAFCCTDEICDCPQTFDEWHEGVQKARAGQKKSVLDEDSMLALKSLALADYLKCAAVTFPSLSLQIDRLMYEILLSLGKPEQIESFEAFHQRHEKGRMIYRPAGTG